MLHDTVVPTERERTMDAYEALVRRVASLGVALGADASLQEAAEGLIETYRRLVETPHVFTPRPVVHSPSPTAVSQKHVPYNGNLEIAVMAKLGDEWTTASALLRACGGRERVNLYGWETALHRLEDVGLLERRGRSKGTLYRRAQGSVAMVTRRTRPADVRLTA